MSDIPGAPMRHPLVPALQRVRAGKVRDTYAVGNDLLLMVASDRISAFDVILPTAIPFKGAVLNGISAFWFERCGGMVAHHMVTSNWADIARMAGVDPGLEYLARRCMLVRRALRIDIECVVRGYIAGSGWREYLHGGTLAGKALPRGMLEGQELPEPAFTPAIKNDAGHDENISVDTLRGTIGDALASELESVSRQLYEGARAYALERGIIIADTKFEFGHIEGKIVLIDELLTPDSSRLWPADQYRPGALQPSYDKQPVRDYLVATGWNQRPPAPHLPDHVAEAASSRYLTAFQRITGTTLDA